MKTFLFIYIPNTWKENLKSSHPEIILAKKCSYPPYVFKVSWICSWEKVLFTPISRAFSGPHSDRDRREPSGATLNAKCTEPYGNYNDVYVLSIDRRVKCELREAFSEMSYALFTPHPDYSEEGGWQGNENPAQTFFLPTPVHYWTLECKALDLGWEEYSKQASALSVQRKSWHRSFETW